MPVLRNMGHAVQTFLPDGFLCDILSIEDHLPLFHGHQSCNPIDQFRLTVTVNTGHTEDLPFSYLEGNISDRILS